MNQGWVYQDRVAQNDVGLTLLQYYTHHYRHSPPDEWQSRIVNGQILLNGQTTNPQTRLEKGDHLTYQRPPWEEPAVPLEIEVLYEDADVMVVAKPSGLPVLPGGGFLEHTLLWQLHQRYPEPAPLPVHRLGRGTSGLLLLARSPRARADLSQQLRDRKIRKVYRALTTGDNLPNHCIINQPIGKVFYPALGDLYAATPTGKNAQSEVWVLQRQPQATLVQVVILTGRPHQIRIHLAWSGCPLVGDPLYDVGGVPRPISAIAPGDKLPVPGDGGYYLHAYQLEFNHPRTGRHLHLQCKPPANLQSATD